MGIPTFFYILKRRVEGKKSNYNYMKSVIELKWESGK